MRNKRLKIAFLCIYSYPSICGVWSRVYNLARLLVKQGHKVAVFSTNTIKGSDKKSCDFENYENLKIRRFKPYFAFGENVKFWNPKEKILDFKPDIIIAEVYRHPHTHLAIKLAKKLNIPCILETHAPFVEPELRSKIDNFIAKFYDKNLGSRILKKFSKIVTITRWEEPYLESLGIKKSSLEYIPNGISEEFFKLKRNQGKDLLFLGRISPIKNLEVLIQAIAIVKESIPEIKLRIIGPAENEYKFKLESLIKTLALEKNVLFLPAVFDINKKIKLIDQAKIFILPSKREAMPISLIEAMSRARIVIASDNKGSSEIIKNRSNGFLYSKEDSNELANLIIYSLDSKNKNKLSRLQSNARKTALNFKWDDISTRFLRLLLSLKSSNKHKN